MSNNDIHPTAVIADSVTLGVGNIIGPYAVVLGNTTIGDDNWIGPHAAIGAPPEVYSHAHRNVWDAVDPESAGIRIGSRNRIHEFVTIHSGWAGRTGVGDDCFIMAKTHLGHDVVLHDRVTLSAGATLGGHVEVWPWANLGMLCTVHQKVQVGPGAMIGMASAVRKDAPAFTITLGNPARTIGINEIGLTRNGCPQELVASMTDHLLGRAELPGGLDSALARILTQWAEHAQVNQ